MLSVVDHAPALGLEVGQRLLDDAQVVLEGGAQHIGDMQRPGLANHSADRRTGVEQRLDVGVIFGAAIHPAGGTEGCHQGMFPPYVARPFEELGVLGVRARPTAFDKGYTQFVEFACNADLVGAGKRDAFALGAVTQSGVVDLDHGFSHFRLSIIDFRLLVGPIDNQKSPISNSLNWRNNNNDDDASERMKRFHWLLLRLSCKSKSHQADRCTRRYQYGNQPGTGGLPSPSRRC